MHITTFFLGRTGLLAGSVAALLLATGIGCSDAGEPLDEAAVGQQQQAIMYGGPSPATHDAVVKLVIDGVAECTGTLITPNLVLTARHCVTTISDDACASIGQDYVPSSIGVLVGANTPDTQPPVAFGQKIVHDNVTNTCSNDIALLELDRAVPGAKVAPVRFTPAALGEPTVLVGYGHHQGGTHEHFRQYKNLTVTAIGPAQALHRQPTGQTIPYTLPAGEIATAHASCSGDSGGPLLDAQGNVIGVSSRGLGYSCDVDQASIFSDITSHEKLIRDAASAAGHPLGATIPDAGTEAGAPVSGSIPQGANDGHFEGDGHDHDQDEDDDERPRKKKSSGGSSSMLGCSAVPGPASSGAPSGGALGGTLLTVMLVLARTTLRRVGSTPRPRR